MSRMMKLDFEKGGVLHAKFLDDKAPVSSQLFWEQLPLEINLHPTCGCGHEIYSDEIPVNADIQEENLIYRGSIGDGATVAPEQSSYLTELQTFGLTTLCFVYGPDQYFRATEVQTNRATKFLEIVREDIPLLKKIGHRIRIHGREKVVLSGYEE